MTTATTEDNKITQSTFKESPYADASWEIVGPPPTEQKFTPMQLAVLPSSAVNIDGMFADYGGFPAAKAVKRWHLPEDLAAQEAETVAKSAMKAEEEQKAAILAEVIDIQKKEAFDAGVAEGKKQALAEMEKREQTLKNRCQEVLRDLQKQIEEQMLVTEQKAVELAIAISNKLVSKAVEINPEYILQVIKSAFQEAGGATVKQVRISPEDHEFIAVVGGEELKSLPAGFEFISDPSIKSGCVLETSAGQVDMQIESGWARVSDMIMKAIR